MSKTLFQKIRRKVVVAKFTMARGYIWCQIPTMVIIAAGVIKPWLPNFELWELALIGFSIFMVVGLADRFWGFLNEEQSYATERNTLLMEGLFGKGNKK